MSFTAGQKLRASQMPGYTCTSTTRPTGHTGQTIYETDTGMVALYTGTGWNYLVPTGEIGSDAAFNGSAAQTIANTTDTIFAAGTTVISSPLVTRTTSGVGHRFTLNRTGRWAFMFNPRWGAPGGAIGGERYAAIRKGTAVIASNGFISQAQNSPTTMNVNCIQRCTSGEWIEFWVYQNSGGSRDLENNSGASWGRCQLTWLGP
ncbi:hypothetical protein [Pseudonocardia sp. NPDC049154]|uniref:hypothetical protein n=1 Tax=Pseudonocardia sp. NPDC049154 TaxID=3155501 RepID=UPI0033F0D2AC